MSTRTLNIGLLMQVLLGPVGVKGGGFIFLSANRKGQGALLFFFLVRGGGGTEDFFSIFLVS